MVIVVFLLRCILWKSACDTLRQSEIAWAWCWRNVSSCSAYVTSGWQQRRETGELAIVMYTSRLMEIWYLIDNGRSTFSSQSFPTSRSFIYLLYTVVVNNQLLVYAYPWRECRFEVGLLDRRITCLTLTRTTTVTRRTVVKILLSMFTVIEMEALELR